MKPGGPALLFEKPKGYGIPVLINSYASMRKMEIALEVDSVDEIAARICRVSGNAHARRPHRQAQDAAEAGRNGLVLSQDRVEGPVPGSGAHDGFSLYDYPVLKCWPEDGGRFITLPLVFSRNPDTGKRNCGMYRMQIFDERTAGMHWQTHKQGAEHYRRMRAARPDRAWTWPWPSAPTRPPCFPPSCRCRRIWTK